MPTLGSPSPDQLVDLTDAAAEGWAGYSTLRRWITEGILPAVKVGARIKVRRADLEALAVPVREQTFEDVEAAVERIVASAPPLTDPQVRRLAALFGGGA